MTRERTVDSLNNLSKEITKKTRLPRLIYPSVPSGGLEQNVKKPDFKLNALTRSHSLHLHAYDRYTSRLIQLKVKHTFTCKFTAVPSCRIASEYTVQTVKISLEIVPMAVADEKHVFFSIELFNSCSVSCTVISVLDSTFQICHICNCANHQPSTCLKSRIFTFLQSVENSHGIRHCDCREASYKTGLKHLKNLSIFWGCFDQLRNS